MVLSGKKAQIRIPGIKTHKIDTPHVKISLKLILAPYYDKRVRRGKSGNFKMQKDVGKNGPIPKISRFLNSWLKNT